MKKLERLPAIALVFPDVFKSVAVAFKKYMPEPLDSDMMAVLYKKAVFETERLVGTPVKDVLGPMLTAKLEATDRYVTMAIGFYDTYTSMDEFERLEANEEFVDASIEEEVRRFCGRLKLPYRKL